MCECYKIDGPFIGEDPTCEIHGRGGLWEKYEALTDELLQLRKEITEKENTIYNLREEVRYLKTKVKELEELTEAQELMLNLAYTWREKFIGE